MKTFLLVLLILFAVIFLAGFLRVGGTAEYSEEGLMAWARIGSVKLKLFSLPDWLKKKKKAPAKTKKTQKKAKKSGGEKKKSTGGKRKKPAVKKGGNVKVLLDYLPLVPEFLGDVRRKLLVEELFLDYTLSGRSDPAHTAILYGQLCAGEGVVTAALENTFNIKKRRISVNIDFMAQQALVYARLTLSFRIWQLVGMLLRCGWKAFQIWRGQQKNKKDVKVQNTQPKEPKTGGNTDGKEASGQ